MSKLLTLEEEKLVIDLIIKGDFQPILDPDSNKGSLPHKMLRDKLKQLKEGQIDPGGQRLILKKLIQVVEDCFLDSEQKKILKSEITKRINTLEK